MRKVPGDARRAARGRRKSGEDSHQGRSSSSSFDKQNKQSSKHQTKFVFLTIIFCFFARYFDVPIIHHVASK